MISSNLIKKEANNSETPSNSNSVLAKESEVVLKKVLNTQNDKNSLVDTGVIKGLRGFLSSNSQTSNSQIFLNDGNIKSTELLNEAIGVCQKSEELLLNLLSIENLCIFSSFNSYNLRKILLSCSKFNSQKCFIKLLKLDGIKNNFSNWSYQCLNTALYFLSNLEIIKEFENCFEYLVNIEGIEKFSDWDKLNIFKTFSPEKKVHIIFYHLWELFGTNSKEINISFIDFFKDKRSIYFEPRSGKNTSHYDDVYTIKSMRESPRNINNNETLIKFLINISNFNFFRHYQYMFRTQDKLMVLKFLSAQEKEISKIKESIIYLLNTENFICGKKEQYPVDFINGIFLAINLLRIDRSYIEECLEAFLKTKNFRDFDGWDKLGFFKPGNYKNNASYMRTTGFILELLSTLMPVENKAFYDFYEEYISSQKHSYKSKKEIENIINSLLSLEDVIKEINPIEDINEKKKVFLAIINSEKISEFTNSNNKSFSLFLKFCVDLKLEEGLEKFLSLDGIKHFLLIPESLKSVLKACRILKSEKGLKVLLSQDNVKNLPDLNVALIISFLDICKELKQKKSLENFLKINQVKKLLGGAGLLNCVLECCCKLKSARCIELVLGTESVISFSAWGELNVLKGNIPSFFYNIKTTNNGFNTFINGKKEIPEDDIPPTREIKATCNRKINEILSSEKETTDPELEKIIGKKVGTNSFKRLFSHVSELEEKPEKENFLLGFLKNEKIRNFKNWQPSSILNILNLCLKLKSEILLLDILSITGINTKINNKETLNLSLICCKDMNSEKGLRALFNLSYVKKYDFQKNDKLGVFESGIKNSWLNLDFTSDNFNKFINRATEPK